MIQPYFDNVYFKEMSVCIKDASLPGKVEVEMMMRLTKIYILCMFQINTFVPTTPISGVYSQVCNLYQILLAYLSDCSDY